MSTVIKVENLGKQYNLGQVGTGTIANDVNRWWHKVRGKEDPYLKIGSVNDRTQKSSVNDVVWAIKDINFEVKQGEVLGIIGKNGAGKSTLLKILSRVTGPTVGDIKVRGRIAALLEVGTGFHPELTGRENIYLNGAILGMTKAEIKSKFDEIVAFSGVERYIDTPVKRYSSGMYVRLAFAVAAHLEPEILIVDEVLAVGDAEFQKKCLGKMKDVSGQGRTVLFVSHNMAAVETLCTKTISMKHGSIIEEGNTTKVISNYLQAESSNNRLISYKNVGEAEGNEHIKIMYAAIENGSSNSATEIIDVTSPVNFRLKIINQTNEDKISVGYDLKTIKGDTVFGSGGKFICKKNNLTELLCHIPPNFLNDNVYQINVYFHTDSMIGLYTNAEFLTFEIRDIKRETGYLGKINGLIRPQLNWEITN
ncbi:MAG: ABC transporter ATP-binding protein [Bacteroidia bacterium]